MNKKELYAKLSKISYEDKKRLNITDEEINFIKQKLINKKIGLKLDFKEFDRDKFEEKNYFILREIEKLNINVNGTTKNHLLIEGDNFQALRALQVAGQSVDIIYIDPPYNTGKEFIYSDDFSNDPKPMTSDDPHKHSKYLSFMKKRLRLAKEIISDEGIICVSIDDNEQAYLKVLMDEIFGENNFICCFPRAIASGGKNNGSLIAKEHEYILLYGFVKEFKGSVSDISSFKLDDGDGRGKYQLRDLVAAPGAFERKGSQTNYFLFKNKEFKPTKINGESWYWRWGSERMQLGAELNLIVEKNGRLYSKLYAKWDFKQGDTKLTAKVRTQLISSRNFINNKFLNGKGSADAKNLGIDFSFPKPVALVKELISLHKKKNATILDFFAGSGTTGQSVMELNEEDGGNRRFILITNNENTKKDINIYPEDGIARKKTYERLFRVINGIGSKPNHQTIKWEFSKELKSLKNNSVKYLKVEEVHKVNGEYEKIDFQQPLYKEEFNKEKLTIEDFE